MVFFSSLYHFISKNCPIYEHLGPNQRGNLAGNGVKNKNRSQFFGDSAHKRLFPLGTRPAAAFSVQKMEHGEDVFVFFAYLMNGNGMRRRAFARGRGRKQKLLCKRKGFTKILEKKIYKLKTKKRRSIIHIIQSVVL